jgi:hypothetical protein
MTVSPETSASASPALPAEPGARELPGRVPDFFIVGHPKCGTTALYEMLRSHPQIYMPALKEPAYFATDLRSRFQRPSAGPLPLTLEDYCALFGDAAPEQRVGEASSGYLVSRTAARNIAQLAPGARAIAILREPASFLRSLHLQLLQNHIETERDLRRALALEPARRAGRRIPRRSPRPQALLYSERLRYVEQLRRFREQLGEERLLVVIYDDLRRDNEAAVRRVLRFLDVRDTLPVAAAEANPTVRVRSQQLDDIVHAVSVGRGPLSRAAKASIKALTPAQVRRAALRATQRRVVLAPPPPVDVALMAELRRRFAPEVFALSEYLGRDLLQLWGYDGVT